MKKYLSLIAVLALLVACMIPAAFAADINVTVGNVDVELGEGVKEVKVPVTTGEIGVAAGQFDGLTVSEGAKFIGIEDGAISTLYNEGSVVLLNLKGVDVVGTLFYVVVEVPVSAPATFTVSFASAEGTSVTAGLDGVAIGVSAGTITVKHDCVAGDWETVKEATCTEEGLMVKKCTLCDKVLEEKVIAKIPHTEKVVPGKAATCTETGLTEGKVCAVCNEVLVAQKVIDKVPHTEKVVPAVAPTCTETGLTEGKVCAVCNEVLVKQEVVAALGHKWGEGVAVADYDCDKEHEEKFTCSVCKVEEVRKVAGHDHKITKYVTDTKTEKVDGKEITYDFVVMKCAHGDKSAEDFHGCSYAEAGKWVERSSRPVVGDITPAITMAALTVVAIVSGAAYMLIKRKAI